MSKKLQIAVIGSAGQEEYPKDSFEFAKIESLAFEVGQLLAIENCILVNGGKSGIMEYSAKGAKSKNGITVGVVKGNQRGVCNPYIDFELVTNMQDGGDAFLIPRIADGAIIIGGGAGTLAEITGFYGEFKPIVAIKNTQGWADKLADTYLDQRKKVKIVGVNTAKQAVEYIISAVQNNSKKSYLTD